MGSNKKTESKKQQSLKTPTGDVAPIIWNLGQLQEIEEQMGIDPRKPIHKFIPLYQDGKIVAYLTEELVPRIQAVDNKDGKPEERDWGWGAWTIVGQREVNKTE